MRWWETSIGGTVRGKIIGLLRRKERSVDELASELGVTDNAARAQLQLLEKQGVVHQSRIRHTGTAGKPAALFAVRPEAEPLFSSAYAPVLGALIESLEERLSPNEMRALFRDAGRRIASQGATKAASNGDAKTLDARVHAAAELLGSLGAEIDVQTTEDGYLLCGHACPLSDAVRKDSATCQTIEEVVSQMTGCVVRECCDRVNGTRCRFEVRRTA